MEKLKFWIKNLPYIIIKNPNSKFEIRKYFVHWNTKVYDLKGKKIELCKTQNFYDKSNENFYLINPSDVSSKNKNEIINFFQVLTFGDFGSHNSEFYVNGNKKNVKGSVGFMLEMWKEVKKNNVWSSVFVIESCNNLELKLFFETVKHREVYITTDITKEIREKIGNKKDYLGRDVQLKDIDIIKEIIPNRFFDSFPKKCDNTAPSLVLTKNFKKRKYNQKISLTQTRNNFHWGQLKLLLSEINFFNQVHGEGTSLSKTIVVYAGAASGDHIPLLSKMYPDILFLLYDPANFKIKHSENIIICNEFFTDEISEKLTEGVLGNNFLFISDIRGGSEESGKENWIYENNESVGVWVKNMKPKFSLLKFRFPFDWENNENNPHASSDDYEYFPGKIFFQQFAPKSSAETRLFVAKSDIPKTRVYNTKSYEEQMFYFNTDYRQRCFSRGIPRWVSKNYDTCSMYLILKNYLQLFHEKSSQFDVMSLIKDVTENKNFFMKTHFPWMEKISKIKNKCAVMITINNKKFFIKQKYKPQSKKQIKKYDKYNNTYTLTPYRLNAMLWDNCESDDPTDILGEKVGVVVESKDIRQKITIIDLPFSSSVIKI